MSDRDAACCALLYELPLTGLLLGESFHPGGKALSRRLAEQAVVGPGTRVLDIACGTGVTARLLAQEFGAVVIGVDYSTALLEQARHTNAGHDQIEYRQADAQYLPFDEAEFDVVFCECALCTFTAPHQVLAEILRVLKPGGRLALSDMVINAPLPESLHGVLAQALCIAGARSRQAYQDLIEQAGFTAVRYHDSSSALTDTVNQIEQRLQLADVITQIQQQPLPNEFGDPVELLGSARRVIHNGDLGYALFIARRPRTHSA